MPPMNESLLLFSTGACSLCERAEAMLRSMPELARVPVDVIDIAHDDSLMRRYGASIPVLAARDRQIAWPFNADDVIELLRGA
jgi:predicted metal-binding protein